MRDAFEDMGCASRMGRNPNLSLLQQRTQKSNPNLPFPSIASLSLHRTAMEQQLPRMPPGQPAATAGPARHLPSVAAPSRPDARRRPGRSCPALAVPSPTLRQPRPIPARALAGPAPGVRGHPGRRRVAASLLLRCRVPEWAGRRAGRARTGKQGQTRTGEQGQPPPGADSPPHIRAPAASSPGHGGAHPRASSSVSAAASAQASPRRRAPTGRAQQLHASGCASDSASAPAAA